MSSNISTMPMSLNWTFRIIDWSMLLYWSLISLAALSMITLPASMMYDGYSTPMIDAWNWSFASLDVLLALLGLITFASWAVEGEFNPSWWIQNLLLMILPAYWFFKFFIAQRNLIDEQ